MMSSVSIYVYQGEYKFDEVQSVRQPQCVHPPTYHFSMSILRYFFNQGALSSEAAHMKWNFNATRFERSPKGNTVTLVFEYHFLA